jgi:ribonucleoside-diphosphate reductase alpha chain
VSLTGIYDSPWLLGLPESSLRNLRAHAVEVNEKYAIKLGINPSTAVTCVKPSGTVSQLVDSSSGIHPRAGATYWRRVRGDKMDPVSDALIASGVPYTTDPYNSAAWSFTFAKKAPKGATVNADITAIEHLEVWKRFALGWCEHKPSVTVSVSEDEWPEVGAWCYKNFHILSGVSFLPKDSKDHSYEEAPYELCSLEDIKKYPKLKEIDWDKVGEYQLKETEFACSAGVCDI